MDWDTPTPSCERAKRSGRAKWWIGIQPFSFRFLESVVFAKSSVEAILFTAGCYLFMWFIWQSENKPDNVVIFRAEFIKNRFPNSDWSQFEWSKHRLTKSWDNLLRNRLVVILHNVVNLFTSGVFQTGVYFVILQLSKSIVAPEPS